MKRRAPFLPQAALALCLAALCLLGDPVLARPLDLSTSVPPVAALVQQVAGPRARVHALLRPGDNPETFAPTPRQMAHLANSLAYVHIGLPFEATWLPRIRAVAPGLRLIDLRQGISQRPRHHHARLKTGDHDDPDPHLWTDPQLLIRMSETLRDELSRLDPSHSDDYHRNQQRLAAQLHALDRELAAALAPLRGHSFLVFHPAWGYFARRYGLRQLAIQDQGKQQGARWIAGLIDRARREHIQTILVQPQFDQRLAGRIARAIHGRVVRLDPLAYDYQAGLRRLAAALAGGRP